MVILIFFSFYNMVYKKFRNAMIFVKIRVFSFKECYMINIVYYSGF